MRSTPQARPRIALLPLLILLAAIPAAPRPGAGGDARGPLTVAESSDYTATSRFADVLAFIRELQRLSPNVRVEPLCTSTEGREVPLLVLGKPVPPSPLGLRRDGRMVVYIQANIHAGEVEGKEASLMLARDVLLGPAAPYLDRLVLLVAPIFNADGNERISPENRKYQPGPAQGVGVRPNGQNLDLNRDSMKLESPELRGLVRNVLGRWDPALVVDCHTTDGAFHEETVTWSGPLNPNGDLPLLEFQRDVMLPAINALMKDRYATLGIPYGTFRDWKDPDKGWESFGAQTRYVTNYVGLRNRLSILDENYVHADYRTRVLGNYAFLRAILDYAAASSEDLLRRVAEADRRTVARGLAPKPTDLVAIEYDVRPLSGPVTIHGYETEVAWTPGAQPELKKTDRKRVYKVPYYADYFAKRSVRLPFAYLLPEADGRVVEVLKGHGLVLERLDAAATLAVESFLPKEVKGEERLYQGHRLNSLKGDYATETREFPAGTLVVRTGQPLGALASGLLEPEADDGLIAWNFLDARIAPQWGRGYLPVPVHRLLEPANLAATALGD